MHLSTYFPAATRPLSLTTEDRDLLLRSAADDDEAFSLLFERHREGLYGYLYRKLRRHEETEDAVTQTFCNAWRSRASFRGESNGKAWLYQIATRVALDIIRRRRRSPQEEELDPLEPEVRSALERDPVDPVELLMEAERSAGARRAVDEALERLPAEERRLLSLFYFQGYSYDQISELVGLSLSQVRGRLHRIRARMRRDLLQAGMC